MKIIKKTLTLLLTIPFALFAGCAGSAAVKESSVTTGSSVAITEKNETTGTQTPAAQDTETQSEKSGSNILVLYFSRTGEQYTVGVIDKGNTAVAAEMIAEKTGADLFEIIPEDDHYPMTYKELTDVAKREQNSNARPGYKGELPDLSKYDTIFIGAPVWWGDWPMIMCTFFENNSSALSGKKLIPFSTHEGSGLSGFDKKLASAVPGSTVLKGLAIRGNDCQNNKDSVRSKVNEWVTGLGF